MLIFNVLQHLSSAQTGCLFFRELIANSNHVEFINQALSQIGFFKDIYEKYVMVKTHAAQWCILHILVQLAVPGLEPLPFTGFFLVYVYHKLL